MSHDLGTLYYILEWLIRLGALAIVPLRRPPAATRTWLLLIFFWPMAGLVLFWAIGSPRFPAWRRQRFARLSPVLDRTAEAMLAAIGQQDGEVAALAQHLGRLPATGGNMVDLIDDYDAAIARLCADIDAATAQVDILVYIFADDACGQRVADALARAVARGLRVRVMIDPVGSHKWLKGTRTMLAATGAEVREALPFRLWRRTRTDMRNHRKLFVIDGTIGYAGSQNIVAKDFRPGVVNRELVARIEGPAVAGLAAVTALDWALEERDATCPPTFDVPASAGDAVLQLLPSGADYPLEGFETLLIWLVHRARRRVVIVSPYFVPDDALLAAMKTAVARGVTVDLVVSAVIDQRIVNLAQSSYYDELLAAGVCINRYRDYLLHAKTVGIDDEAGVIGSSNTDLRSFQLNEEASLIVTDPATIAALTAIHDGYLATSEPLDRATWSDRSRWRIVLENIARLTGSLL